MESKMYLVSYNSVWEIPDYLEEDFMYAADNKDREELRLLAHQVRCTDGWLDEAPYKLEGIIFLDGCISG